MPHDEKRYEVFKFVLIKLQRPTSFRRFPDYHPSSSWVFDRLLYPGVFPSVRSSPFVSPPLCSAESGTLQSDEETNPTVSLVMNDGTVARLDGCLTA